MWEIRTALSVLIEKHVANYSEESTKPPTYAINFKARKNTEIKKQEIYDSVKALMKDKFEECSVNLTKPDLLIVVQVCSKLIPQKMFTN
jgi:adenylyl- and sulfurtransferase ThiI